MSGSITIIIPTRDRIKALTAVWPSYLQHPDVGRIVVVDDGSTDGTASAVSDWSRTAHIPVDVIRNPDRKSVV